MLRNRWVPNPPILGIVVEEMQEDKCLVLWCTKNGIMLKTHFKTGVVCVDYMTEEMLKKRSCTSM